VNCLVVFAHPLPDSLNGRLARLVVKELEAAGHAVTFLDLYRLDFDPRLSEAERAVHYDIEAARNAAPEHAALVEAADALVLVFPTWWYGLPAILKGWIDRVFAPGVAFRHGSVRGGPIEPALTGLKHFVAITTLGSPWWLDTLVMWQPVRRILKLAVVKGCAPQAAFAYLALHGADSVEESRVEAFEAKIRTALAGLNPSGGAR
jgi:putative NADPH-quinone reductase